MEFNHVSVLLEEVIENLDIKPDGVYVDGTLGGAGHASRVCEKLGPEGMFIGLDQDETAIRVSTERLAKFGEKVHIVKSNYVHMKEVLKDLHVEKVDGILLDLGVSSYQLDTAERGFSYMEDAPLDMRMDRQQSISAMEIVNEYPQEELYRIIKEYGEERYARNIAKNICLAREEKKIETTFELVDIIRRSMPAKARNGKGHPAKRTFQAIRIECNHELDVLRQALDDRFIERFRKIVYYHIPFFRGQNGKTEVQTGRKSMYLPSELSGMCVRQSIKRESDYEKTDSSVTGRTGRKFAL